MRSADTPAKGRELGWSRGMGSGVTAELRSLDSISESAAPINAESCSLRSLSDPRSSPCHFAASTRHDLEGGAILPLGQILPFTYPASGTRARRHPSMVCQF